MKKLAFLLAIIMILSAVSCTDPAPIEDEESTPESAEEQMETASDETDTNSEDTAETPGDNKYTIFVESAKIYSDVYSDIFTLTLMVCYEQDSSAHEAREYLYYSMIDYTVPDVPIETDELIHTFEQDGILWRVYTVVGEEVQDALLLRGDNSEEWYLTYLPVSTPDKPVIYLYPETPTDVTVRLDYVGELTHTYPKYDGCWCVTAYPDGTLIDADGREYYCLFWEGRDHVNYDMSEGFCVAGDETEAFLEDALAKLGLNDREANEFIIYWLPQMENNAYNLISFQKNAYTDAAKLFVDPAPDTVIRVFMTWKALDAPVDVAPQILTAPEREGFVLVEWGATELD